MLVHLGYPKTASTFLQTHFFNNRDAGLMSCGEWWDLARVLIKPNPLWYERAEVERSLAPQLSGASACGLFPVVTHELLVGHPVSGGHEAAEVARRLKELWPDAVILMVIREQQRMLYSIYAEYTKNNGPLSLEQYLDPPGGDRQPVFDFRYLEFHRLIEFYHELFGAEQVKVLPFELFQGDPLAFCNRILGFVGRPPIKRLPTEVVRASLPAPTILLRSYVNRWFMRDRNNPVAPFCVPAFARWVEQLESRWPDSFGAKCRARLTRIIDDAIGNRYAGSNQRTSKLIGMDLAGFDYPCARPCPVTAAEC